MNKIDSSTALLISIVLTQIGFIIGFLVGENTQEAILAYPVNNSIIVGADTFVITKYVPKKGYLLSSGFSIEPKDIYRYKIIPSNTASHEK